MSEGFVSRGFGGRRRNETGDSLPPGQYLVGGFPVLSAGPTPRTALEGWDFTISGEIDGPKMWTWEEFTALASEEVTRDIHCVTKWSKLGTTWRGVSVDTLLERVDMPPSTCSPSVTTATPPTSRLGLVNPC
jgi:DMSO/TMAO reductase YedYZ molybdopterin-dependent catalytic subunit